jgi:iron complex transport system ATP-binding protein
VVALRQGAVYADGPPAQVLTETLLREVFGINGRVMPGPDGVDLIIVPIGRV